MYINNTLNYMFDDLLDNLIDKIFFRDELKETKKDDISVVILIETSKIQNYNRVVKLYNKNKNVIKTYNIVGIIYRNKNISVYQQLKKIIKIQTYEFIAIKCGLDYHIYKQNPQQKQYLKEHIKVANEFNLPLFLYERCAFNDIYDSLKEANKMRNIKCAINTYTLEYDEVVSYLNIGLYIIITDTTFDKFIKTIKKISENLDLLILFLHKFIIDIGINTTMTYHEINNDNNCNILLCILQKLADIINIPLEDIYVLYFSNMIEFFDLIDVVNGDNKFISDCKKDSNLSYLEMTKRGV